MKSERTISKREEAVFNVSGLWCASCAQALEKKISSCAGVEGARVDFATSQLWVEYSAPANKSDFEEKARGLGYRISDLFSEMRRVEDSGQEKFQLGRIAFVFFFSMWSLIFSITFYQDPENRFFLYLGALFSLPAFFLGIAPFAEMAYLALKAKSLTFDFLVVSANGLLMISSAHALLNNLPGTYFETVSMTLALLLTARFVDAKLRDNLKSRLYQQFEATLGTTRVLIQDEWARASVKHIKEGRRVKVGPREIACLDFRITNGNAWVNCSQVNGESLPAVKGPGDFVLAGEKILEGEIEGVVIEPLGSRWIDQHIFSFAASFSKGREKSLFEKLMPFWIPTSLLGATMAAALKVAGGESVWDSLAIASVILLATCPCALALIEPIAQLISRQALLRLGVRSNRNSRWLAKPKNTQIFFDKTGTLTTPVFQLSKLVAFSGYQERGLLHLLASASWSVEHPYSQAASAIFGGEVDRGGLRKIVPGIGIEWFRGNGQKVVVRKPLPSDGREHSEFQSLVFLDGALIGGAKFQQSIAKNVIETLRELKEGGYALSLVSGDRQQNAQTLLSTGLFDEAHFETTPEKKRSLVKAAKAKGLSTVFIGDGLNDIQAMAESDFSLGVTEEMQFTTGFSDASISPENFSSINSLLNNIYKTQNRKQWAYMLGLSYNFLAAWFVFAGALHPLLAVSLMTIISTTLLGFLVLQARPGSRTAKFPLVQAT